MSDCTVLISHEIPRMACIVVYWARLKMIILYFNVDDIVLKLAIYAALHKIGASAKFAVAEFGRGGACFRCQNRSKNVMKLALVYVLDRWTGMSLTMKTI